MIIKKLFRVHKFGDVNNPEGESFVFTKKLEAERFYQKIEESKDKETLILQEPYYIFENLQQIKDFMAKNISLDNYKEKIQEIIKSCYSYGHANSTVDYVINGDDNLICVAELIEKIGNIEND